MRPLACRCAGRKRLAQYLLGAIGAATAAGCDPEVVTQIHERQCAAVGDRVPDLAFSDAVTEADVHDEDSRNVLGRLDRRLNYNENDCQLTIARVRRQVLPASCKLLMLGTKPL